MDPDRLLEEMPGRVWQRWKLYAELEPWGAIREDLRAGLIASVIVNGNPYRAKDARSVGPEDWFSTLKDDEPEEEKEQTAEDQVAEVQALALAWGAC